MRSCRVESSLRPASSSSSRVCKSRRAVVVTTCAWSGVAGASPRGALPLGALFEARNRFFAQLLNLGGLLLRIGGLLSVDVFFPADLAEDLKRRGIALRLRIDAAELIEGQRQFAAEQRR